MTIGDYGILKAGIRSRPASKSEESIKSLSDVEDGSASEGSPTIMQHKYNTIWLQDQASTDWSSTWQWIIEIDDEVV